MGEEQAGVQVRAGSSVSDGAPCGSTLRVFIGYDERQPLAYNVLQHSIARHSSEPVSVTPLILKQLPITRRGLTDFTFSRFLVPWLCGYEGVALFLDADMVVVGDIAELFAQADPMADVQVMKKQAPFEWASAMLFNNAACMKLDPAWISDESNHPLDLKWARKVGWFDPAWNHAVGYSKPAADVKLYHYTQGVPCWHETKDLEPEPWLQERDALTHTVPWADLMVTSVHAEPVLQRLIKGYQQAAAAAQQR